MKILSKFYVATVILLLTFSSVYAQKLECFVLSGPEKNLKGIKKIAIVNIEGQKGNSIAASMLNELIKEKRGIHSTGFFTVKEGKTYIKGARTNVYKMLEREQIEAIMKEQGFNVSGLVDDSKQIAEVGKILGVDALIFGHSSYTHKDEKTRRSYKDKNGKVHTSYCTKRTVIMNADIKIVSVETAEILGTKKLTSSAYDKKCDQ